jgi:predicted ATPase/transcriptional regulator with XRE-family HTH domain
MSYQARGDPAAPGMKGRAMAGQQERFGERLLHYREAAGYSQEELAQRAELSAKAISALEQGERKRPYPDTLRRLAEAPGLSGGERAELAATLRPTGDETPVLAPQPSAQFELPGEPTPLIGRERETEVVRHLLAHPGVRLLTLTGPGGVGKTRLALHVALAVGEAYPDGVVWVELAPLGDPELVLPTIARSLGLQEALGRHPRDALSAYLRCRRVLLVLDNFEHVLNAATDMAALLRACSDLGMLATSRAPLNICGEQEYLLPPLELPPTDRMQESADVASVPSVQLFVWQARQKDPSFDLSSENSVRVAAICRRLDGVPLALELAAARVKLLGITELLARLDRALPVLTGSPRDLPARQRTMEGTIRWNYDLLAPPEQALFRRLAVFAGGWTLEAAEEVVHTGDTAGWDIIDSMAMLVDHSLVRQMVGRDATRRFTMLETFREFGLQRLEETGERGPGEEAHLAWCTALAEAAETGLAGPEQVLWLTQLEAEHDNLRAALGTTSEGTEEARLRLAGTLWRFWWWHGHLAEGRAWLERLLDRGSGRVSAARGKALVAAGILAREQGDLVEATTRLEESLSIRRSAGDKRGTAQSLNILGLVAGDQGEFTRALELYEEGLHIYREVADQPGTANVLNNLGIVAREQGDFPRARQLYEEALGLYRKGCDKRGMSGTLHNLGRVAFDQGDFDRATALYQESMEIRRELGDRVGIAMTFHNMGNVAREQGNTGRAAELYKECLLIRRDVGDKLGCIRTVENTAALAGSLGDHRAAVRLYIAADALRAVIGAPIPPADHVRNIEILTRAHQQLPANTFEECVSAGAMP